MKSILSLPTVLQEVWRDVYAAGVQGELSRFRADGNNPEPNNLTLGEWAEAHAWEAVRRANGGEMPGEASTSNDPTDEEMVEALAPIVARNRYEHFAKASAHVREEMISRARCALTAQPIDEEDPLTTALGFLAIASWKAARAWGRK